MSFKPDKYQQRIIQEFTETNNNIIVQAVAGAGKTSVLIELLNRIPPNKEAFYGAFNRHVVESLKARFPLKQNITISTLNSFGARMLYKTFGSIALVENKYFLIALKLFKNNWKLKENKWSYCYNVSKIVDIMRFNFCFDNEEAIVESCAEYGVTILKDEIEHALQVFEIGVENINQIDFLDQIFLPVIRKIRFVKFPFVLIDEIQDLSALQHQFIKKLLVPVTGRLIAVGDKNQAIYHFSGAKSDSFEAVKQLVPNIVTLPMSFCYRCPKTIVEHAKELVPQIEAAPNAKLGAIKHCNSSKIILGNDTVICRNTKPLVLLCRDLIKQGKKATIKGREVGENLIILIRKTKAHTIEQCLKQIRNYEVELRLKLLKKGVYQPDQHKQMLQLTEKKEIIKVLTEQCGTISGLIKKIEQIFVDESTVGISLMTIHKAKGQEWDRVWFLNSFLIPSVYAVAPEEMQQEMNIKYVAITRVKKELIYINQIEPENDGIDLAEIEEEEEL